MPGGEYPLPGINTHPPPPCPQHAPAPPSFVIGLPGVEERISVGFLKLDEHVLDKLPRYAQAYDVVILGDGDMSYANEILHEVVG